jgi:ATP synthase protein I
MARAHGDRDETQADEAALTERLERLGKRLGAQQTGRSSESSPGPDPVSQASALSRGLRLSTEFIVGILVGAAIGWFIDWSLGTSPWGLIAFLLLGFAAGVLNMVRAAREFSGPPAQ